MKQGSLFNNLPQINDKMKKINKDLIERANNPQRRRAVTVRGGGGPSKQTIQARLQVIKETASQSLEDDGSYEQITDPHRLRQYMETVRRNGVASLDTETTGLDPIEDRLVGISLYTEEEKPAYIPIYHTDISDNEVDVNLSLDFVKEQLEQTVEEDVGYIFHNAKFDMRVLKNQLGMDSYVRPLWDTHIAANLLNENERHGLKALWNKYVRSGREGQEAEAFDKLFDKLPFNYVPVDIAYIYAAKDAEMTWELYQFQKQFLDKDSPVCKEKGLQGASDILHEVEVPIIQILCEMEDTGVGIDSTVAESLEKKYREILDRAMATVQDEINKIDLSRLNLEQRSKLGNPVNPGSSQQLAIIFYDAIGLKSPDRRKPRGTGEDILEKLMEQNPEHKKLMESILQYRGVSKLLSTYIEGIPKLIKEKTGKVHTEFKQYGAKTGRFSSAGPNLQNIPSRNREIRKMFIPSDGYVLVSADYSQQEPRVLAHLCYVLFDDRKMMDAYLEGRDLYAWMASQVYNKPYEECKEYYPDGTENPEGDQRRESVKSIILGLMYGRQTASIAEQIGMSVQETERITNTFFREFPAIRQVIDYYREMVRRTGYIETVYGRKRRLPEYNLPPFEYVDVNDRRKPIEDEMIKQYYNNQLSNAWGPQKQSIKQDANARGIWVIENGMKISEAERQILNSVVQGSSADITKMAMRKISENDELKEIGFRLLIQVHDELIGEAPKESALRAGEIMSELMLEVTKEKIVVPMSVDAEYTDRWFGEDVSKQLIS